MARRPRPEVRTFCGTTPKGSWPRPAGASRPLRGGPCAQGEGKMTVEGWHEGSGAAETARPLLFLDFEASSLSPGVVAGGDRLRLDRGRGGAGARDADRAAAGLVDGGLVGGGGAGARHPARRDPRRRAGRRGGGGDRPLRGVRGGLRQRRREQRWLDRLRQGRPRIEVRPLRRAMLLRLAPHQANRFCAALLRGAPAHRAGADADRLARAWLGATEDPARAA